jgi:hypothetical protein
VAPKIIVFTAEVLCMNTKKVHENFPKALKIPKNFNNKNDNNVKLARHSYCKLIDNNVLKNGIETLKLQKVSYGLPLCV